MGGYLFVLSFLLGCRLHRWYICFESMGAAARREFASRKLYIGAIKIKSMNMIDVRWNGCR
jgi:hypothetical protein